MTLSTFFVATIITIVSLIIIVKYWQELLLIGVLLEALWTVTWTSFLSTLLWACFVTGSSEGWMTTYLYFFLTYTGILIAFYFILSEAVGVVANYIKKLFK